METNNSSSMTIASIEEFKECIIDVNEKLEPHPECCIYRVPKVLRKANEEAYTPKFGEQDEIPIEVVQHFTDMKRYFMTKNFRKPESPPSFFTDLPCAVKLQASGVNFNRIEGEGECLLDLKFVKKKRWILIPGLQVVELQIPKIVVHGLTECEVRNVMALEQCHYPQETLVCNYIDIMDMLIDTEEDVNLLVEAGIISNNLGDGARVANMFNKLGQEVSFSPSYYSDDIFRNLRAHYDNPRNHVTATLKRVYFNNLWRGTATVAAGMLLLLTLIQTIFSVKSGV